MPISETDYLWRTVDNLQSLQWYDLGQRHGHKNHCPNTLDCPRYLAYVTDHRDRRALLRDLIDTRRSA